MYVSIEIERGKEIEIDDTAEEGNCTNAASIREQRGSNIPVAIAQVYHREITPPSDWHRVSDHYPTSGNKMRR